MRRRFIVYLAPAAVSLLSACSLLSAPKPEPATAILSKVPANVPHQSGEGSTLLVMLPASSSGYDTTRMAYREKAYQLGYYRDNQWAGTPAQMIQPLLVQTLQETGMFQSISSPPESGRADYTLRTEVMELVQDYTGSQPTLRLALHFQLLNASGQVMADREILEQEPMRNSTSYAGVDAANEALANALREAAQFVMSSAH
jgi:cholesterol transport system auxiliary component